MNTSTKYVYDVVLDLGKTATTLESALSKEDAEALKAVAVTAFVGVRVVERLAVKGHRPHQDTAFTVD
jgi:hypothetical protein